MNWCFFALAVIGFAVFLAPVFTGILNAGNAVGMAFFAAAAVLLLNRRSLLTLMDAHKSVRIVFAAAASLTAALFIGAVIISVFMIKAAGNKPENPSAFIVLGCRVKGERPSLMLQKRIDAAYRYLMLYPDAVCVLSGGQGNDELISEAECMFRGLTAKGISPERLIKEDRSTNTYENILFSRKLLEDKGISGEAAIVSNEFHLCRASLIAKKQGLETTSVSAPTSLFLLPTYWVRDCLGVAYEFFLK